MEVKCVLEVPCLLGEGPTWQESRQRLYWVDILGKAIHALGWPDGGHRVWKLDHEVGSVGVAGENVLVAALDVGFGLVNVDQTTATVELIGDPESDRRMNRFNDGCCDWWGRFWAGSMNRLGTERTGAFWILDPDRSWRLADAHYAICNGPAFAPDGETAYLTDSAAGIIWRVRVNPKGIQKKEVFRSFSLLEGTPDGMAVDADGGLWVALWGAGKVTRFRADGRASYSIDLPVSHPTKCAFGGPDLRTLFITSARTEIADADLRRQPLAGSLFAFETGIRGTNPPPWGVRRN